MSALDWGAALAAVIEAFATRAELSNDHRCDCRRYGHRRACQHQPRPVSMLSNEHSKPNPIFSSSSRGRCDRALARTPRCLT